jgi:S1-C subfamily serine protease
LLTAPRSARADTAIYHSLLRSTTLVFKQVDGKNVPVGTGSLLDKRRRLVVTNLHAVGKATNVAVCFPILEDGKLVSQFSRYGQGEGRPLIHGTVRARDSAKDLALIELQSVPESAKAVTLAADARLGGTIHTITNDIPSKLLWNFMSGVVRGVYQRAGNPGPATRSVTVIDAQLLLLPHSGGPAVNEAGELVGYFGDLSRNRLLYLAVDVSEVREFLQRNQHATRYTGR